MGKYRFPAVLLAVLLAVASLAVGWRVLQTRAPEPKGPRAVSGNVRPAEAKGIQSAVMGYLHAYAQASPEMAAYSDGDVQAWGRWISQTPPPTPPGKLTVRHLTVTGVDGGRAIVRLDALTARPTLAGEEEQDLAGPMVLQKSGGGWRVADYVMNGRDQRAAVSTDVVGGAIKRDVVLQAVGVVLQERETLVFARLTDPRYLVSSSGVRLLEPSPSSAVDPAGIGTVFDGRDGMVLVRFDRGLPAGTKRIRFSLGLLTGPYVSGLPTVGEVMDVSVSLMDTDAAVRSPLAPIPTSEPSPSYGIRGVYGRDESPSGFDIQQRDGFNYIDTGPSPSLVRRVAANGLKAFVWLGGYDNGTCRFNRGSGWVRAKLADLAETAGIGAYLVADGPNSAICPAAPSQIRKRSELIRSIDAEALTVVAVQPWNGVEEHPYADFAGVTDVIGIKVSPCSRSKGCDYLKIDAAISAADSLGMPYWGIVQAYADSFYRFPSPAEIHEEFRHWRGSAMSGYLVLGWRWPPHEPRHWLANHPALRAALRVENHS